MLPLVLVLVVVGALVVVPLMGYAITVMRSNTVLSERTKSIEAAKGAVRVALGSPLDVFRNCEGGGHPVTGSIDPVINGITVGLTCSEEAVPIGPLAALGYDIPMNVVALQLGSAVPDGLAGITRAASPGVPPYPETGPGWWQDPTWTAREWAELADGEIWLPDLPRIPSTVRSSTPFDMPAGFNCRVFFPGRYADPVVLSGNVYFASGVYYFENTVSVTAGADVVVGYGLADFVDLGSDCADDIQVAANVIGPPATFDINGGGATWVFGGDGRFLVDDSAAAGNIRVRFNQRYATEERGGRISIMTVNGDHATVGADHFVHDVNRVPRSYTRVGDSSFAIDGTGYVPSSSALTDKAREPLGVLGLTAEARRAGPSEGAILVTWDESVGQQAGGARLGVLDDDGAWTAPPYQVQIRVNPSGVFAARCLPDDLVITPKADPADGNEVSCLVSGLDLDQSYRVRVRARNEIGPGPWTGRNVTPTAASPLVTAPGAPTGVVVAASAAVTTAVVSWGTPDNGGGPITGYDVTATRVFIAPPDPLEPVVTGTAVVAVVEGGSISVGLPAFDPNGDALTLTVDDADFVAAGGAPLTGLTPLGVTVDAGAAPAGSYTIPYSVADPGGLSTAGSIEVNVVAAAGANQPPVAPAFSVAAEIGAPMTVRVPAYDPDGDTLTLDVDTSALDPAEWTVGFDPAVLAFTFTTDAPDGSYSIPYTVADGAGLDATGTVEVRVERRYDLAGTCSVTSAGLFPIDNRCEISGLPDLAPVDGPVVNLGYRFDVVAHNTVGDSDIGSAPEPYPLGFDGGGAPLDPPTVRLVVPWVPQPVIAIDASNVAADVTVDIPGYVAVPMGRLAVRNPNGDDVRIRGGVVAGTFDVDDARDDGSEGSVPIGFENDFVLQRKVRIVATARNIRATAVVQINEDGAGYAINSWVVQ